MRKVQTIAMVCLFLVCVGSVVTGQRQEVFDKQSLKERGPLSSEQESTLRNRQELILSEASTSSANDWVGRYSFEDGLTSGARLDWAPANGFVVWWSTCSHGWRDRINFGGVEFRNGVLRLIPELGGEGEKVYDVPADLFAVKWGEQHYLVPSDRLIAFCYAARNAGRSSEIDEFFLKESDREKRRFGLPSVPVAYRKYLLGPPVQATIVGVKSQPDQLTKRLTLNVGRKAGVVPGMKFFALTPRNVYVVAEITHVSDTNAEAYVMTSSFKNRSDKEVKPRVGWKLTSRAPRRAYDFYPG